MTLLLTFLLWIACAVAVIAPLWVRRDWRRWRIAQGLSATTDWSPRPEIPLVISGSGRRVAIDAVQRGHEDREMVWNGQ